MSTVGSFYRNQGSASIFNTRSSSSKNSILEVRYGSARDLQRKVVACFCGSPSTVTVSFSSVTLMLLASIPDLESPIAQIVEAAARVLRVDIDDLTSSAVSRTPLVSLIASQVPTNSSTNKRQLLWRASDCHPVDKNLLWIATPRTTLDGTGLTAR